jgi:acyl-coenzyme A synthetase/AMP-(fatty) acid ligase
LEWYNEHIPVPAIDHWWQTESGWPMIANMMGVEFLPIKPGSAGKAVTGYDIQILGENGQELNPNEEGYVVLNCHYHQEPCWIYGKIVNVFKLRLFTKISRLLFFW